MTLDQLFIAVRDLCRQHGPDVEVIVRGTKLRPRQASATDEWELLGVGAEEPQRPWEGGEVVAVLRVEG